MILIAIGSNLRSSLYGMPENNCLEVVKILRKYFFVVNVSNFYKTEPIPKSSQPWYVNAAVEIKTNLKPKDIIERLFFIENHFGRIRIKKNEARVIDLDLLCYGNLKINKQNLIIPHPRLHIRKFVIKPICDINPLWKHPILKKKAINLLKGLANQKIFNINSTYGKSNY
ncbi:MAG: 2-amino-4-hydroxy-6-hydroxymethyldihydropteridine diphosphokinase [Rickettsiales bacterium]|nr:2-amino-4-hydroxy-6-hydroxymethyldihydropteridine diphosphokinase [Rickettsiales bacterium]